MDALAINSFLEYLSINTSHPNPDYNACAKWLKIKASEIGFDSYKEFEFVNGKPIVILSINGTNPNLSSILLNSHVDVVPAQESQWTFPPFSATRKVNGDIVARGTQDMKCVGIAYLEAIRRLLKKKWRPDRTIHLSFVPDEEIGGHDGMKIFVNSKDFESLNIGFALDEGLASPTNEYSVFYAERKPWWIKVTAKGNTGHGSRFIDDTAMEKMLLFTNKALEYSQKQKEKLSELTIGNVTTINLTMIRAGRDDTVNIVPEKVEAYFDIRLDPWTDVKFFESIIESWGHDSDVNIEYISRFTEHSIPLHPTKDTEWWPKIESAFKEHSIPFHFDIFTGATDSRFIRPKQIPVYGISPIRNTPILLHDHDEFINQSILLEGIKLYESILNNLSINQVY